MDFTIISLQVSSIDEKVIVHLQWICVCAWGQLRTSSVLMAPGMGGSQIQHWPNQNPPGAGGSFTLPTSYSFQLSIQTKTFSYNSSCGSSLKPSHLRQTHPPGGSSAGAELRNWTNNSVPLILFLVDMCGECLGALGDFRFTPQLTDSSQSMLLSVTNLPSLREVGSYLNVFWP